MIELILNLNNPNQEPGVIPTTAFNVSSWILGSHYVQLRPWTLQLGYALVQLSAAQRPHCRKHHSMVLYISPRDK